VVIAAHSGDLAAGAEPVRGGSLLEDGLDLEADRHLVADRDATAVHRNADVTPCKVSSPSMTQPSSVRRMPAER
jgi:hypothetical protein